MKTFRSFILTLLMLSLPLLSQAQCVMCKAAAESSLVDGKSGIAIGINDGIFYLAAFPYIIIFTLIYLYMKRQEKLKAGEPA